MGTFLALEAIMTRKHFVFFSGLIFLLWGCAGQQVVPREPLSAHLRHEDHLHKHGPSCKHRKVQHGKHVDYEHDGHYHAADEDHYDEHGGIPAIGTLHVHAEAPHLHEHGKSCGHTSVKHGDHVDYIHDGHYHTPHGDHYDEHGIVKE